MKKLSIVLLALLVFGCGIHTGTQRCRLGSMNECDCPRCVKFFTENKPKTVNKSSINKPSIEETLNSLKGHHISEVIRKVGPASQVASDEAGGRIHIWVFQEQRKIPKHRWVTEPQKPLRNIPTPQRQTQRTTTDGTMRWNPILKQWEFKSETRSDPGLKIPDISGDLVRSLNDKPPRSRLKVEYETRTNTQRIMLYTRPDGTIYHCLID